MHTKPQATIDQYSKHHSISTTSTNKSKLPHNPPSPTLIHLQVMKLPIQTPKLEVFFFVWVWSFALLALRRWTGRRISRWQGGVGSLCIISRSRWHWYLHRWLLYLWMRLWSHLHLWSMLLCLVSMLRTSISVREIERNSQIWSRSPTRDYWYKLMMMLVSLIRCRNGGGCGFFTIIGCWWCCWGIPRWRWGGGGD